MAGFPCALLPKKHNWVAKRDSQPEPLKFLLKCREISGIFKAPRNRKVAEAQAIYRRNLLNAQDYITLRGLKIKCIIGIFYWERRRKQNVLIDLKFPCDIHRASRTDRIEDTIDYKKIAKTVIAFVEKSRFRLVETLAEKIADLLLGQFELPELSLSVLKPGAIRGSKSVGITIHRTLALREEDLVVLSLGSNIQPALHLNSALKALDEKYGLRKVSRIYETSPVSRKKQPSFWNMVVAIQTHEPPVKIRKWLKQQEKNTGRIRGRDSHGPRTLDVDLILWNGFIGKSKEFIIPHPDISQKAFVLFPLVEILPNLQHPVLKKTMIEIASEFKNTSQKIKQLSKDPLADLVQPGGSQS